MGVPTPILPSSGIKLATVQVIIKACYTSYELLFSGRVFYICVQGCFKPLQTWPAVNGSKKGPLYLNKGTGSEDN